MKLPLRTKLLLALTVGAAGWRVALWLRPPPPPPPTPPVAIALAPRPDAAEPPPVASPPLPPAGPDSGAALTEEARMAALREAVDPRPAEALALARSLAQDLPDGRFADERAWLTMQALVHLNRIAEARDEAKAFYARSPRSAWAERVFQLTGYRARPRPGPTP